MSSVPVSQTTPAAARRRWKARLLKIALVLFVLWLGFVAFMWRTMHRPPEQFARVMSHMPIPAVFLAAPFETLWVHARSGELQRGDRAPNFDLLTLDKTARVSLASLNAKGPVVLVFGSYT